MAIDKFTRTKRILEEKFEKRTIHSQDQFEDWEVQRVNGSYTIKLTSSQLNKAYLSGTRQDIERVIKDLQEIIEL